MNIKIASSLIKELRSRTGAGFLECKRALIEENGNIELSIDNLRKSGKLSAEKKVNNTTNQGAVFLKTQGNIGVILELNCETDFVAKDSLFLLLGEKIMLTALQKKIKNLNELKSVFEDKRTDLVLQTGENINIRRFHFLEGENICSYLHGVRIGVLLDANFNDRSVLKNIAMHIAASKPEYLSPKNVSNSVFEREYKIQSELVKKINKPFHILEKIIEGRMNKFVNSISLTSQNFIMEPDKTVGDILNEKNGCIKSFIRFQLGEIIH